MTHRSHNHSDRRSDRTDRNPLNVESEASLLLYYLGEGDALEVLIGDLETRVRRRCHLIAVVKRAVAMVYANGSHYPAVDIGDIWRVVNGKPPLNPRRGEHHSREGRTQKIVHRKLTGVSGTAAIVGGKDRS
ncbi:MAG TPA: hypothetical protein VIT68_02015 [Candidatus Gracilibacteria bacterium]